MSEFSLANVGTDKTIKYIIGDKCRFKGKVQPGDKLKLEMKVMKQKGPMGVGEAVATVDGKVVVKAELTFMVG